MNKYMKAQVFGVLALVMLAACTDRKTENSEKEGVETILPAQVNEVTVMKLEKKVFNHELVSNGKIQAKEYADLYFRSSEIVAKVWVKNGDYWDVKYSLTEEIYNELPKHGIMFPFPQLDVNIKNNVTQ